MKKCPKCNRLYSDFTDRCPECNISLSGGQDALNSINNTYQQPQPSYQQPQNTYQQPRPSYQQPQNTYQQPQPSYQQPQNTYQQPQNTYQGGSAVVKPKKYTLLTILCAVAIIMFLLFSSDGFIQMGNAFVLIFFSIVSLPLAIRVFKTPNLQMGSRIIGGGMLLFLFAGSVYADVMLVKDYLAPTSTSAIDTAEERMIEDVDIEISDKVELLPEDQPNNTATASGVVSETAPVTQEVPKLGLWGELDGREVYFEQAAVKTDNSRTYEFYMENMQNGVKVPEFKLYMYTGVMNSGTVLDTDTDTDLTSDLDYDEMNVAFSYDDEKTSNILVDSHFSSTSEAHWKLTVDDYDGHYLTGRISGEFGSRGMGTKYDKDVSIDITFCLTMEQTDLQNNEAYTYYCSQHDNSSVAVEIPNIPSDSTGGSGTTTTTPQKKKCMRCNGNGKCPICKGEGRSLVQVDYSSGHYYYRDCEYCIGGVCSRCNGTKYENS